uniref:Putative RecA n=1 Tax=viral metagenome TaxID=1070528 RepID=A0A6M3JYQ8_9ZZZZ
MKKKELKKLLKDKSKVNDTHCEAIPVELKIELTKEQKEKKEKLLKIVNEWNRENKEAMIKFAKDEPDKERLPFGNKRIDELTGNGGIAGNFIIIWGGEAVGKSTLCLMQVAEAQKRGKICAYIDLEHGFDKNRALLFNVNLEELLLIENCNSAEDAMNIVITLSKEKVVDLIIVDSIQAMTPIAENESKKGKERDMKEDEIALLAKKMGKFLRRTSTPIYKAKIAVTLIGQSRTGGIGSFATHEELTGGRAQKHWSLLTLFMRTGTSSDAPTEKIDTGEVDEKNKPIKMDMKVGFDCVIKIQKTKTSSKPQETDIHIPYFFKSGFYSD